MSDESILGRYYRARFGEPEDPDQVYGTWAVVLGGVLGILGILGYVGVDFLLGTGFFYRQFAIVAAMLALPAVGVGVALLLPLRRLAVWLVAAGFGPCVLAAAGLVYYYPGQFNVGGGTDMAPVIVLVYLLGILVQWLTVVLSPLVPSETGGPVTQGAPGRKGRY